MCGSPSIRIIGRLVFVVMKFRVVLVSKIESFQIEEACKSKRGASGNDRTPFHISRTSISNSHDDWINRIS